MREKVYLWSYLFPLDAWWRDKHKVAPFSNQHYDASIFGMIFEYLEDKLIKEDIEKRTQNAPSEDFQKELDYIDMTGERVPVGPVAKSNGKPLSNKEIEEDFDKLDITKF